MTKKITKNTEEKEVAPKKVKPKQLTMAKIKREAVSTRKMEDYELNDTDTIRFYPVFAQGKINEMLKEYQNQIHYATEKGIMLPEDKVLEYVYFLCIKHFTSLKKGISDKYENQLLQMDYLVDSGYYSQIINEVFMKSEIEKVLNSITDVLSTYQLLEQVNVQIDKKTEDLKIKNKDMLNVLAEKPYVEVTGKH